MSAIEDRDVQVRGDPKTSYTKNFIDDFKELRLPGYLDLVSGAIGGLVFSPLLGMRFA